MVEPVISEISNSPWNPPTAAQRLRGNDLLNVVKTPVHHFAGDLFYLEVTTLEGRTFTVTSHVNGFFVNASNEHDFDPSPAQQHHHDHNLHILLARLSPLYLKQYRVYRQYLADTFHPSELVPPMMDTFPWIISGNIVLTKDRSRQTQTGEGGFANAITVPELTHRDLNEEFQGTLELPTKSVTDQILKDRAIARLYADFVDVALKATMLVVQGSLAALNPLEPKDQHIFQWNGVFVAPVNNSLGIYKSEEAARVMAYKDLEGVRIWQQAWMQCGEVKLPRNLLDCIVEYAGRSWVIQSVVPGILRRGGEGVCWGTKEQELENIDQTNPVREVVVDAEFERLIKLAAQKIHCKTHRYAKMSLVYDFILRLI